MEDLSAANGVSPFLAYEIMLDHLPNAPRKLKECILEGIAQLDRRSPLVLKDAL